MPCEMPTCELANLSQCKTGIPQAMVIRFIYNVWNDMWLSLYTSCAWLQGWRVRGPVFSSVWLCMSWKLSWRANAHQWYKMEPIVALTYFLLQYVLSYRNRNGRWNDVSHRVEWRRDLEPSRTWMLCHRMKYAYV